MTVVKQVVWPVELRLIGRLSVVMQAVNRWSHNWLTKWSKKRLGGRRSLPLVVK